MSTPESLAESVKNAIAAGHATSATRTTLHTLLGAAPQPERQAQVQAERAEGRKAGATRVTRPRPHQHPPPAADPSRASARTRTRTRTAKLHVSKAQPTCNSSTTVAEPSHALAPKARYALATEVINISLKVLSNASTSARTCTNKNGEARALQVLSANVTPVKDGHAHAHVHAKPTTAQISPSKGSGHAAPSGNDDWTATAECASLAFSHMRSIDADTLGLKGVPKLQLEKGMLALAARLAALRLHALAVKELRATKKRLESVHATKRQQDESSSKPAESDNLARLLVVDIDPAVHPEWTPLLVSYQSHVLSIIANTHKPAIIEEALEYLRMGQKCSPCRVILAQFQAEGDHAKAIRQLESLCHAVLRLCPSLSPSADAVVRDPARSPSPLITFQLQVLALSVKQQMWDIAKHEVDIEKDLAEPLSRALSTFIRRSSAITGVSDAYQLCNDTLAGLGLANLTSIQPSAAMFTIHRTLSILAERAGLNDVAHGHAKQALHQCSRLGKAHARYVAALTRRLHLCLKGQSFAADVLSDLEAVDRCLLQSLSGSGSDYEMLLGELYNLVSTCSIDTSDTLCNRLRSLARASGGFASRFAKGCPDKQTKMVSDLLALALYHSKTNEDLVSWMSKDTVRALIQTGALKIVTEKAASQPMTRAWSSASAVLALSRALKALVLRHIASVTTKSASLPFDDENLAADERCALFELQLKCALEVAHKPKYHTALSRLIPELFEALAQTYVADLFPIRRARVAALALRVREEAPDLLAPHTLQVFKGSDAFDMATLANDESLQQYALDVKTSIAVSRALFEGPATSNDLKLHLMTWQTLIEQAQDAKALEQTVDSPAVLLSQLTAVESYLSMLGDDEARLPVTRMMSQIELLWGTDGPRWLSSLVRSASAYLTLGYAEKAGELLETASQAVAGHASQHLEALEFHLHRAEHLLTIDQPEECRYALECAVRLRDLLPPDAIPQQRIRSYRLVHGRGWLMHSRWLLASGYRDGALEAAKRAVKLLNGIWSSLERQEGHSEDSRTETQSAREQLDCRVDTLVRGVSKLNLKPADSQPAQASKPQPKGAAYWPVVRLLCDALCHLCTVFIHHGSFQEANFASEKAVKIASTNQSGELFSRMQYRRCLLLASAGKVDEAELCLARDQEISRELSPLAEVERFKAKAAIAVKQGDLEDAFRLLTQAQQLLQDVQCDERLSQVERFLNNGEQVRKQDVKTARKPRADATSTAKSSSAQPKGILKKTSAAERVAHKTSGAGDVQRAILSGTFYVMQRLCADISCQKAVVAFRIGSEKQTDLTRLIESGTAASGTFARCLIRYMATMRNVADALQADFSFNVLPESTLSFPSLQVPEQRLSLFGACTSPAPKMAKSVKIVKSTRKGHVADQSLGRLLLAARKCMNARECQSQALTTYQVHMLYSMLSDASLLLSATSAAEAAEALHPVQEAMGIEMGRINASQCHLAVAKLEVNIQKASDFIEWPRPEAYKARTILSARSFKQEYIEILPTPWTVVSLSLNQTCDELYAVRYRSDQTPLVVRLPFSRQKSDDANEEMFDFHAGQEELQNIIQLSNYSCHNPIDTSVKGAKTNWWSEREALDQRLQVLLINMENIWFGGFKGLFSQHEHRSDQVDRFRASFDVILGRHLPSRRTAKKNSTVLKLDDQILQLFIGLGHDHEGEVVLDEALQDLLYFVVDILQFNGERNAYDEIDFDSMAVEVLDALRDYYDGHDDVPDGAHLILVLDRRLQAFPWESLPCLESASVSRVDSMLTLRERLLPMQSQSSSNGIYSVSRKSGSYILNPSGDLKSTQAILSPELEKLAARENHNWTATTGIEPSENDFKQALTTSSNLLYFGHGAGLQYIRPRAIKKLEKCSEVVWLMGCSSGAVNEYDELEPFAVPMAYMQAGEQHGLGDATGVRPSTRSKCMAVLATLWDVTDKDIDRFSLAVGEEWGLWSPPQASTTVPAKTPRKQRTFVAPSTPDRVITAPKTPKAKKTPAPARTPARSRSRARSGVTKKQSLVDAVAKSRDACYLRYLNGAAPVVYGVPVYLGD